MVYRVFVEKRPGLDLEAKGLLNEAGFQLQVYQWQYSRHKDNTYQVDTIESI